MKKKDRDRRKKALAIAGGTSVLALCLALGLGFGSSSIQKKIPEPIEPIKPITPTTPITPITPTTPPATIEVSFGTFDTKTGVLRIKAAAVGEVLKIAAAGYKEITKGYDIKEISLGAYDGYNVEVKEGAFTGNPKLTKITGWNAYRIVNRILEKAGVSPPTLSRDADAQTYYAPYNKLLSSYFGNQRISFDYGTYKFYKPIYNEV